MKIKRMRTFLEKGNQVQVTLIWKGQQKGRISQGEEIMEVVAEELSDISNKIGAKMKSPHRIQIMLSPLQKTKSS